MALVASRFLPPLLAQVAGSARVQSGADPFAALVEDHKKFVSLLEQMQQTSHNSVFQRTQLLLRLKRRLAAHALAEEDIVYPLLHDKVHAADAARKLYGEHAEIKIHMHALEEMPKNDPAWTNRVGALKALISAHARQEEEVEFPRLREALDARGIAMLGGGVSREKAMIV
jgi:hemerythrin superfamily protein